MARTVDLAKHEAKRQQILGAAYRLFAQKGFAATSTAEISREAGVSTGNLFHYFPTKRAIFSAIFEQDSRDVGALLEEAAASDDPWGGLLDYLARSLEDVADPDAGGFLLAVLGHAQQDPEFAAVLEQNDSVLLGGLTTLLTRAAQLGQIDTSVPPATGARWLAVLLDGVFIRRAGEPNAEGDETLSELTFIVSRFLGAEVRS